MKLDRIMIIPDVRGGEPTPAVCGHRQPGTGMLAGGMKPEEILQDFGYLEQADINACLEYAARHAADREVPLSK